MDNEERIISKYSNRRLYDNFDSKYISLRDIEKLVTNGIAFKVIDIKTKEDVTYPVLVHVIVNNADFVNKIPLNLLRNIIRMYGYSESQRKFLSGYFEHAFQNYLSSFHS